MVTENEKFAARLNEALDNADIPKKGRQYKVGKMFGVSPPAARKWLTGDGMPDTKKIPEIAKRLNTSTQFLLGDDKENKPDRQKYHDMLDALDERGLLIFEKALELADVSKDIKKKPGQSTRRHEDKPEESV